MKRRSRRRYRAIRRVPQAYPGLYLRLKVAPVLPALAATVAVGSSLKSRRSPNHPRSRPRCLGRHGHIDLGKNPADLLRYSRDWTRSSSAPSRTSHGARRASGACGRARSSRSVPIRTGAWPACCPSSPGADTTPS